MSLRKRVYTDKETLITAENMNDIQDSILNLEDGLFSVDNDKSGEVITITDASKRGFRSLNIFGKTTQDGTPTPDAPVDLVSVGGSGSIGATVAGENIFQFVGKVIIENGSVIASTANGGTFQGNPGENPGSSAWSSGWAHFDRATPLHLGAGEVITISADYTVLEKHSSARDKISILLDSYSGPSSLDIINAKIGVKYRISRTVVIPEDGKYKRTTFTTHSSKVIIENVQWEIGAVASDFVPYKAQTLSVSTPNGLPGIPVTYGGNYTDANGQQWICDEIDFARGVYVQRIKKHTLDGTQRILLQATSTEKSRFDIDSISGTPGGAAICDSLVCNVSQALNTMHLHGGSGKPVLFVNIANNVDDFVTYLSEHPITVLMQIAPIETPLPEEELAAYATLYTYKDHTTVYNDAGAYMELEYVMDAKKYIDSLAAGGGSVAKLTNVTLSSSAWKTEAENLHSQVVVIDGITSYSKVDLLPSVEQLAIFHNKDVAFVTENEDGVLTVYAIGDKPTIDYTMQAQITEVIV